MRNIFIQRKQNRLTSWDYSKPGMYYVTICTQSRENLFGNVINEKMNLNSIGNIIRFQWSCIPLRYPNIQLSNFIIMPNHIHGIIKILAVGEDLVSSQSHLATGRYPKPGKINSKRNEREGIKPSPTSLLQVIQEFKSITTKQYIYYVKEGRLPQFKKRIWQRGYYDHIVRNEDYLNRI